MELDEYQRQARLTETKAVHPDAAGLVPILGLAGEVGELMNEYKKHVRDGNAHTRFVDRLSEELGDILWYISATASRFNLSLDKIATSNLSKTKGRWTSHLEPDRLPEPHKFDEIFPAGERFPRQFRAEFVEKTENGKRATTVFVNGQQMGQSLTDNSWTPDGYRFHDVFHLACVAVLGWSPVTRRNLELKRRSDANVDEVEDGGRAIVTEEGISALVFAYAADHNGLDGIKTVDYALLKAIRIMTAKLEVGVCTTGEWEQAILRGYRVWKEIEAAGGGKVALDLDRRTIEVVKEP